MGGLRELVVEDPVDAADRGPAPRLPTLPKVILPLALPRWPFCSTNLRATGLTMLLDGPATGIDPIDRNEDARPRIGSPRLDPSGEVSVVSTLIGDCEEVPAE